jgi:hypothetical protein
MKADRDPRLSSVTHFDRSCDDPRRPTNLVAMGLAIAMDVDADE